MLTYSLFKTQGMLLSGIRKKACQILTYNLFKTQSMLLSATRRKSNPDADLHSVENPEDALLRNKQEGLARCWLTYCSKPRVCSCQQKAGKASWMLTYILFKTKSMLLLATSRNGQPDADLQTIQDPEDALISNKQEWPARCWLTFCSKARPCFYQQQAEKTSHMLTYILFKTQMLLFSAKSRKSKPDADLHTFQNIEHALVSNKQERPARCWLTYCSKPRACFCQQQARRASQMLTYILFKAKACSCQQQAGKGQMPPNLQTIYWVWEYAFVSIRGWLQAKY